MATEESIGKIEVGIDMNKITGEEISEETWGALTDRIVEESTEIITEMKVMIETGTGLEKGHFPEAITTIGIGIHAIVGSCQDLEWVQRGIQYDVISVGNMIISWSTVPLLRKKDIEQLQQMLNLGDE